jgi:sec-independent protein translocase protein TatA
VDLGPAELAIILVIVVLIFGTTRLKDLGGSLGQGIKEFRAAVKEDDNAPAATTASTLPPAEASSLPAMSSGAGGEVISAVKCPSCGNLNVQTAKFCDACGAALAAPVSQN